ncbi:hypothetical protein Moror_11960 [Moniliophthora roreri MCA 2997]|uniref:Uncharacterized protein n=1 Tax=Moniliophthora roreri (strain MCA 2997) TaxID=1381753 RepID=V2WJM2_MONRO|nr:hypothetical protein Moror_11960 [Moniliophthora roreri MCA 2997]
MSLTHKFSESQSGRERLPRLRAFDVIVANDVVLGKSKTTRAYEEEGDKTEDEDTDRESQVTYAALAAPKANTVNVERIWGHDTDEEVVILEEDNEKSEELGTSTMCRDYNPRRSSFNDPTLRSLPPKKRNRDVRVCLTDNGRRDHWDIIKVSERLQSFGQAQARARISIPGLVNDEPLMTLPPKLKGKKGLKSIRTPQSQMNLKEDEKRVDDAVRMSDSVMNYHDESERMVGKESMSKRNEGEKKRKRGSGSEKVQRVQPRRSCKRLKLIDPTAPALVRVGS